MTTADIVAFSPRDPGYFNYVREHIGILESRILPDDENFDISEPIGLMVGYKATDDPIGRRFRRYRTFIISVGFAINAKDQTTRDSYSSSHSAYALFDDAYTLGDAELLALLDPAFDEYHAMLKLIESEESPFLLLARILVGFMTGKTAGLTAFADALFAEESEHYICGDFLWDIGVYAMIRKWREGWQEYVRRFVRPESASLALLREALLEQ